MQLTNSKHKNTSKTKGKRVSYFPSLKKHHFLHFQGKSKTFPLHLKKGEAKQTS